MWRNEECSFWNLSANADGCRSLIELLTLMANAKWSSSAKIAITAPAQTANGPATDSTFPESFTLSHPKDRVVPDHWQFSEKNPILELGCDRLKEMLAAVQDIADGIGDYSIGLESCPLWVWWWIEGAENGT